MPRRTDEDFINRSLLDSLDAQADAEPVSSSDSEAAPPASFGSSPNSSSGSPSAPYHIATMQSHQQLAPPLRSDSPPPNMINNTSTLHHTTNHIKSAPDSMFTPQNTSHNMYNNIHIQPEFSDLDGQKQQQQSKMNVFAIDVGSYRTSTGFNAFSTNRSRQPTLSGPYRDSTFGHAHPTAADVFPVQQLTSPTQLHQQPTAASRGYDLHQGRGFDFGTGNGSQAAVSASLAGHTKQSQYSLDPFGTNSSSSALLQSHQVSGNIKPINQPSAPPGLHPQPSQHQQSFDGYQHHQPQVQYLHLQSQTPYGPHLQTSGPGAGPNGAPISTGPNGINGMTHLNGTNGSVQQGNTQEEISTIFVVGFPEDMQVYIIPARPLACVTHRCAIGTGVSKHVHFLYWFRSSDAENP